MFKNTVDWESLFNDPIRFCQTTNNVEAYIKLVNRAALKFFKKNRVSYQEDISGEFLEVQIRRNENRQEKITIKEKDHEGYAYRSLCNYIQDKYINSKANTTASIEYKEEVHYDHAPQSPNTEATSELNQEMSIFRGWLVYPESKDSYFGGLGTAYSVVIEDVQQKLLNAVAQLKAFFRNKLNPKPRERDVGYLTVIANYSNGEISDLLEVKPAQVSQAISGYTDKYGKFRKKYEQPIATQAEASQ